MKRYPDARKILVLKPSSLGDIAHSMPALGALRGLYPDAYIAWFVFSHFAGLLEGNPCLDRVISWKKGDLRGLVSVIRDIRKERFDLVIDLQGLARTALVALASGARHRIGVPGLKEFSWLLEKQTAKFDPKQHAVERNLGVMEYLGAAAGSEKPCSITISAKDGDYADSFLRENSAAPGRLVGMAPSAGIPQKLWPARKFAELADRLAAERGCTAVFFGTAAERPLVDGIISDMKHKAVSAAGKTTLGQLCALIKRCPVFIGNDTGTLHLAAALGVPAVGLYGASDPVQLRPYHPSAVVLYKGMECSPCGTRPSCRDARCMDLITVEEVYSAAVSRLEK